MVVLRTLLALVACALVVPRVWCGWDASAWFRSDNTVISFAEAVGQRAVEDRILVESTGSARFDGEWTLVTCQMTILGLAQVISEHPNAGERLLPGIRACSAKLVDPTLREFGTTAWQEDGWESPQGHAYLGYLNLALGVHRSIDPAFPYSEAHDALSASLSRKLATLPIHRLETYPGETYPTDIAAVAGSVAVHQRVTGQETVDLETWTERFLEASMDPTTGWIRQSLSTATGEIVDGPRGSGTAGAAYFLGYVDPELSTELFRAHRDEGLQTLLGFGGMREYPRGTFGWGDIDSGPVLAGVGVSATGFALAGARRSGDEATYISLFRTYNLFGMPGANGTLTGGPLGDALMLAMLTAQ